MITPDSARQTELCSLSQPVGISLFNEEVAEPEELWMVCACSAYSCWGISPPHLTLSGCSGKTSLHHTFLCSKSLKKTVKYLCIIREWRGQGSGQGFQLLCVSLKVCFPEQHWPKQLLGLRNPALWSKPPHIPHFPRVCDELPHPTAFPRWMQGLSSEFPSPVLSGWVTKATLCCWHSCLLQRPWGTANIPQSRPCAISSSAHTSLWFHPQNSSCLQGVSHLQLPLTSHTLVMLSLLSNKNIVGDWFFFSLGINVLVSL